LIEAARGHGDAAAGARADRLAGIVDEILQDAQDPVGVERQLQRGGLDLEFNPGPAERRDIDFLQLGKNVRESRDPEAQAGLSPGEVEHLLDHAAQAGDLAEDHGAELLSFGLAVALGQQLGGEFDGGERPAEIMDHAVGHLANQGDLFLADHLGDITFIGRPQVFTDVAEKPQHGVPGSLGEQPKKWLLRDAPQLNRAVRDRGGAPCGTVQDSEFAEIVVGTLVSDDLAGTARGELGQRDATTEHEINAAGRTAFLENDGLVRETDRAYLLREQGPLRGREMADEAMRANIHGDGTQLGTPRRDGQAARAGWAGRPR